MPFYSISSYRIATFFGNHHTKPRFRLGIPGQDTIRRFPPVENKPLTPKNIPIGKNGFYFLCALQPTSGRKPVIHLTLLLTGYTGSQTRSSLGATPRQNPATALGGHPFAEAVIV